MFFRQLTGFQKNNEILAIPTNCPRTTSASHISAPTELLIANSKMNFSFPEISTLLLLLLGGQTAIPLGVPPGPEDPVMFQMAPEDCLFYTTWASVEAPDPNGSITEKWLAQPELGESYRKLMTAIRTLNGSGSAVDEAENFILTLVQRCLQNACSIYLSDFDPNAFPQGLEGAALITLGDDATDLESQLRGFLESQMWGFIEINTRQIGDWTIRVVRSEGLVFQWGVVDNKYLAVTIGEGEMEQLLDNMKSETPQWLADLKSEITVDRISAVTSINIEKGLGSIRESLEGQTRPSDEFEKFLEFTGLGKTSFAGWVSGLDEKGFLCRGILEADGESEGIFGILAQTPLEIDQLAKVSNDPTLLTAGAISFPKLLDLLIYSEILPDLNTLNDNLGLDIDIKADLIDALDEHAYIYGSVNVTNPTAGWVVGIGASSEMEITDGYERIIEKLRELSEDSDNRFESSEFNDRTIYSLTDESTNFMATPPVFWTLADGELLISLDKSSLRRHIRRDPSGKKSLAMNPWITENAFAAPRMDAEGPLFISAVDLPSLIKIGVPLLAVMGGEIFPPRFDYDVDDLPSVEVLTRDMQPNVTALFRTPEGWEVLTRQTYPGSTPGSSWGLLVMGLFSAASAEMGAAELRAVEDIEMEHAHEDHDDGR